MFIEILQVSVCLIDMIILVQQHCVIEKHHLTRAMNVVCVGMNSAGTTSPFVLADAANEILKTIPLSSSIRYWFISFIWNHATKNAYREAAVAQLVGTSVHDSQTRYLNLILGIQEHTQPPNSACTVCTMQLYQHQGCRQTPGEFEARLNEFLDKELWVNLTSNFHRLNLNINVARKLSPRSFKYPSIRCSCCEYVFVMRSVDIETWYCLACNFSVSSTMPLNLMTRQMTCADQLRKHLVHMAMKSIRQHIQMRIHGSAFVFLFVCIGIVHSLVDRETLQLSLYKWMLKLYNSVDWCAYSSMLGHPVVSAVCSVWNLSSRVPEILTTCSKSRVRGSETGLWVWALSW